MMKGRWQFCQVVPVYPDEKGEIKEVEIMITSLDKLIELEQGDTEAKLVKINASNLIIIGLK